MYPRRITLLTSVTNISESLSYTFAGPHYLSCLETAWEILRCHCREASCTGIFAAEITQVYCTTSPCCVPMAELQITAPFVSRRRQRQIAASSPFSLQVRTALPIMCHRPDLPLVHSSGLRCTAQAPHKRQFYGQEAYGVSCRRVYAARCRARGARCR